MKSKHRSSRRRDPGPRAVITVRLFGVALLLTVLVLGLLSVIPEGTFHKVKSRISARKDLAGKALSLLADPTAPPPVAEAAQNKPATAPVDTVWTYQLTANGGISVLADGSPVITTTYNSWKKGWTWVGTNIKTEPRDDGSLALTGAIDGLGVRVAGTVDAAEGDRVWFTWLLDASETLEDITGTVLEFHLDFESSALGGATGTPELLPGYRGWRWEIAPGQAIEAAFDEPLPNVYFERNNASIIRMQVIGSALKAGTHARVMSLQLPEGSQREATPSERYGPADTSGWHADALLAGAVPVDLRHLNHTPAGSKGFVRADGDRLVFEDGTEARFWGGNLAAYTLFWPDEAIEQHAERIAKLGYNLMRFHHHDSSSWVNPSVLERDLDNSLTFNYLALDRIDYWVKCLKEQGVYVWVDLHVGRVMKPGDQDNRHGTIIGFDEILRAKGSMAGFSYFNDTVRALMADFNETYVTRVNPYTGLSFAEDPAIMGFLITNENDLPQHYGNLMLPDKNNPEHNRLFEQAVTEFAEKHGLNRDTTWRTWVPGPSKLFLNDREHRFNRFMLDHLAELGVRVPVATTNFWGNNALFCLPALATGGIIDIHSYGGANFLDTNPRHTPNFISWIASGQVHGMPVAITEWNVPHPAADRFAAPLYVAAIAAFQGWDAPMIYTYSQEGTPEPNRASTWSTFYDPAFQAIMPAAALLFREGHVRPAETEYCLQLTREQLFFERIDPETSATLRTLAETSKLTIGLPDTPELDWDRATIPGPDAKIISDLATDFIPAGASEVVSDTGELRRDWERGLHTIETPRTLAAAGWFEGKPVVVGKARFEVTPPKAIVAVTSLDGQPLDQAASVLITTVARVVASEGGKMPFLSEPVAGTLTFPAREGLSVYPLNPDGTRHPAIPAVYADGSLTVQLDGAGGTHWYLLE